MGNNHPAQNPPIDLLGGFASLGEWCVDEATTPQAVTDEVKAGHCGLSDLIAAIEKTAPKNNSIGQKNTFIGVKTLSRTKIKNGRINKNGETTYEYYPERIFKAKVKDDAPYVVKQNGKNQLFLGRWGIFNKRIDSKKKFRSMNDYLGSKDANLLVNPKDAFYAAAQFVRRETWLGQNPKQKGPFCCEIFALPPDEKGYQELVDEFEEGETTMNHFSKQID